MPDAARGLIFAGLLAWALLDVLALAVTIAIIERKPIWGSVSAAVTAAGGIGFLFVVADMMRSGSWI